MLRKKKTELNILLKDLDTARANGNRVVRPAILGPSCEGEQISLDREEIKRKISHRSFVGTTAEWEDTRDAKSAADTIQAHKKAKKICQRRMKQLDEDKPCRSLMASFTKLFTTLQWTYLALPLALFPVENARKILDSCNCRLLGRMGNSNISQPSVTTFTAATKTSTAPTM